MMVESIPERQLKKADFGSHPLGPGPPRVGVPCRCSHLNSGCNFDILGRLKYGAPGEIRTPDLTLRRRSLYPAELRARDGWQLQFYLRNVETAPGRNPSFATLFIDS